MTRTTTLLALLLTLLTAPLRAEDTPTLTTTGGTYTLVTDANALQDNDIVIIASHSNNTDGDKVRIMTTPDAENTGYFGYYTGATYSESMPESITLSSVNENSTPSEFIVEGTNNAFYLKHGEDYLSLSEYNNTKLCLANNKDTKIKFIKNNDENFIRINLLYKTNNTPKFLACNNGSVAAENGLFTNMGNYSQYYNPTYLYRKTPSTTTTAQVTVTALGYATLYYGTYDVTLPEGLTAYTYLYNTTTKQLTPSHKFQAGDKIPANTAVILRGKSGTYDITLTTPAPSSTDYTSQNNLRGTDNDAAPADGTTYYVLNNDNGTPVFRLAPTPFTCQAHKAYLALPISQSEAKQLTFILPDIDHDDATALPVITTTTPQNPSTTPSYDLTGRQHTHTTPHHLIIQGGKKYAQ